MKKQPAVSVLMCTYNRQGWVGPAIESILNQSYEDFELLILDDASDDGTNERLAYYQKKDKRIRIYANRHNSGCLGDNSNFLLKQSQGAYIARMDDDDLALKNRLQTQISFMQKHEHVDICGSWVRLLGAKKKINKTPVTDEEIKARMIFGCPLVHSSVVIRKDFLDRNNLSYNPAFKSAEDYELWSRCLWETNAIFYNLPEVLVNYRYHANQVSTSWSDSHTYYSNQVLLYNLQKLEVTDPGAISFLLRKQMPQEEHLKNIEAELKHLLDQVADLFPRFGRQLTTRYYFKQLRNLTRKNARLGYRIYKQINLFFTLKQRLKFRILSLCTKH